MLILLSSVYTKSIKHMINDVLKPLKICKLVDFSTFLFNIQCSIRASQYLCTAPKFENLTKDIFIKQKQKKKPKY